MEKNKEKDISIAEKVVDKQLKFYNSSDLEGFASTYTEDIEIYDLPSGKLKFKSKDDLIKNYSDTFKRNPKARIENRIIKDNKIIDNEYYIKDGMDEEAAIVAIYEVDLEKKLIAKVWFIR